MNKPKMSFTDRFVLPALVIALLPFIRVGEWILEAREAYFRLKNRWQARDHGFLDEKPRYSPSAGIVKR